MQKKVGSLKQSIKACPKDIPVSAELYVQDKQAHAHVSFKCFVLHRLRLILCALEIVMATTCFLYKWKQYSKQACKTPCRLIIRLLKLASSMTNKQGSQWHVKNPHTGQNSALTGCWTSEGINVWAAALLPIHQGRQSPQMEESPQCSRRRVLRERCF